MKYIYRFDTYKLVDCFTCKYLRTKKRIALKNSRIGNLASSVLLRPMSARIIVQSLYIALDLLKSHLLPLWLSTKFRFLFRVVSILLSKMWLLDKGRDMGSLGENMMGWMQSTRRVGMRALFCDICLCFGQSGNWGLL